MSVSYLLLGIWLRLGQIRLLSVGDSSFLLLQHDSVDGIRLYNCSVSSLSSFYHEYDLNMVRVEFYFVGVKKRNLNKFVKSREQYCGNLHLHNKLNSHFWMKNPVVVYNSVVCIIQFERRIRISRCQRSHTSLVMHRYDKIMFLKMDILMFVEIHCTRQNSCICVLFDCLFPLLFSIYFFSYSVSSSYNFSMQRKW